MHFLSSRRQKYAGQKKTRILLWPAIIAEEFALKLTKMSGTTILSSTFSTEGPHFVEQSVLVLTRVLY